ncbi:MAG TPA: hypothetical protein VFH11_11215 [Gemmatimonadota bacterium]|nr:hypothetical protein [Gemmatimonadota bacterium]
MDELYRERTKIAEKARDGKIARDPNAVRKHERGVEPDSSFR